MLAKTEHRTGLKKSKQFSFTLTSAMAPFAYVIMFFETDGGELVADRLVVDVDEVSANEVSA